MSQTDYDIVEYPHSSFSQMSPDRLAAIGILHGMQPAPGDQCRVLELGCGSGGTLLGLGDLNPKSSYWGVDLSKVAIAMGKKRIQTLGLTNVRLDEMDVMNFPADAGEFDYIILHGLFSWVPDFVRKRILEICDRHLAPQGIAYISYNAYPGCYIRQMWRDMMLFHSAQFDEPAEKIHQSREMMRLMAYGVENPDPPHVLAQAEFEEKSKLRDTSVFHDDLSPAWQPFYFREFVNRAADHGMQYLSEASYGDTKPLSFVPQVKAAVEQILESAGVLAYEQYLDMIKLRRFRQTLLCRAGVNLARPVPEINLSKLHFSGAIEPVEVQDPNAPPGSRAFRNTFRDVTATTNGAASQAVFEKIAAAWPRSVSFAELSEVSGLAPNALGTILHNFYASSFLFAHANPRTAGTQVAGEKPTAWRITRQDAAVQTRVTHLHNGSVELKDEGVRMLLQLMDGTRTRTQLAQAIVPGGTSLEESLRRFGLAGVLLS